MPLILLILAVGVYLYLWHQWRTTTLTRDCRWRQDRRVALDYWRCAVCGAEARGREPKDCLRARGKGGEVLENSALAAGPVPGKSAVMKPDRPEHPAPADAEARKAVAPVICYPVGGLPRPDLSAYRAAREGWSLIDEVLVPPREARCFEVSAGDFFRIVSVEGPQVGDLNLFAAGNLAERFFSGKTRALHGTHLSTGDRMWSCLPYLRPMATITEDTLDWYGFDAFGGSVHDVIGTRCDPYTHALLSGGEQYHHCCHSNLTRAVAAHAGLPLHAAELHVHDVLNVFMCTGFTRDTGQYFMKASPVRPGDYLEFMAEIDLLGALSACPGGDCSTEHSSDAAACHPLLVQVFRPKAPPVGWASPGSNPYDRSHGAARRP